MWIDAKGVTIQNLKFSIKIISQMWINSRGLTIAVDDDSPLSVSINDPQVDHDYE